MPIYEFECEKCGEDFEQLILGSGKVVQCPRCGSKNTRKRMSACAFKSGSSFSGTGAKASGSCSGCTSTNCSSCGG